MGLDNLREVDNQGLMIDSIGQNIKSTNKNLVNINVELDNQGQQMDRIQDLKKKSRKEDLSFRLSRVICRDYLE